MNRDARHERRLLALVPQDGGFALPRRDVPTHTQTRLNAAMSAFVAGYRLAVTWRGAHALMAQLKAIDAELAGFYFEGVGMALIYRDAFIYRDTSHMSRFMDVCDRPQGALVSIGAGCAQARLQRPMTILPHGLTDECRPFMEDGYGFHQGLFQSYRFRAKRPFPPVSAAFDYGLGRSLWFVCAADPVRLHASANRFASERRPALWRGIGVACAFTGGVTHDTLVALRDTAGVYQDDLRRGVQSANDIYATMDSVPQPMRLANDTLLTSHTN